jgi:hypothetical protein
MCYTQKMRSWTVTILGALLSFLLWHGAQRLREGFEPGPTPTREDFAKKLGEFTAAMKEAGKTLDVTDSLNLNVAIEDAAKRGDFGQAGLIIDSFFVKYLSKKERIDVLTDLVTDARTRLATLETSLDESKKKGQAMLDQAKAVSDPESLPSVI